MILDPCNYSRFTDASNISATEKGEIKKRKLFSSMFIGTNVSKPFNKVN